MPDLYDLEASARRVERAARSICDHQALLASADSAETIARAQANLATIEDLYAIIMKTHLIIAGLGNGGSKLQVP